MMKLMGISLESHSRENFFSDSHIRWIEVATPQIFDPFFTVSLISTETIYAV